MSTKNLTRTVVIAGILSWPAIEIGRFWVTNQKLHEAQALQRTVTANIAARAKNSEVAKIDPTNAAKR